MVLTSRPGDLAQFFTVPSDTFLSAKTAVQHLLALGHDKIAYISFAQPEFDSVHEREIGWRNALTEAGHTPDPALVEYADISAQSGYDAARRLLARGVKFSALFAGNDTIAFGVMQALREARLRIPQDVAIVGYDDIPMAAFACPPLTTVRTDPIGHAQAALQLLLAQFNGQQTPSQTDHTVQAKLVVRASCGAKPAA